MGTTVDDVETIRALALGDRVRFAVPAGERLRWWDVRAGDERYTILTRQAEFRPKGTLFYTIIDRDRGVRGPCNRIGQSWDVEEPGGCEELLAALRRHDEIDRLLHAGASELPQGPEVEVSYRNNQPVQISEVRSA